MPSNRPKTRFCITIDGRKVEIFSVEERSNKDLIVIERHEGYLSTDLILREKVSKVRYSIHNSQNSYGFLLKQTVERIDGLPMCNAALVFPTEQGILFPFYSKRLGSVSHEIYDHYPREKDKIVQLGGNIKSNGSPIFFIIVTGKDVPEFRLGDPFTFKRINFSNFDLIVGACCMRAPRLGFGEALISRTSAEIFKEETPMWRTKGASSLYAEEINIYLKYFLDRYKLGYIRMYQEKFGKLAPGSEEEKILWELCSWFDRLPAEQEGES